MKFIFLISAIFMQTGSEPVTTNRNLLLFGNNDETLIKQQLQLLEKDSSGLTERQVEVKVINPTDPLYKAYHISPVTPFTIILIGKDGGEKYRSNMLLTTTNLFALIDAMPMRQAEIRKKKKKSA
jgi:C4-dicarboxylate transporter